MDLARRVMPYANPNPAPPRLALRAAHALDYAKRPAPAISEVKN